VVLSDQESELAHGGTTEAIYHFLGYLLAHIAPLSHTHSRSRSDVFSGACCKGCSRYGAAASWIDLLSLIHTLTLTRSL